MKEPPHASRATRDGAPQRVLDVIASRPCSWDELQEATDLTDDGLGRVLAVLLSERKLWIGYSGETRIYGLEGRQLSPHLDYPSDERSECSERRAK